MKQNIDVEILKKFVKINFSEDRYNTKFKISVILLILLSCAWSCKTIHAIADMPNEDTVFYRFKANLQVIDDYLWNSSMDILKRAKHKWKRRKVFLSIDETHEAYTGKFRKIIDWIFGYTQKRGETGSFKFLVFALTSFDKRLVVRASPLKVGQDIKPIILETIHKVKEVISFKAVLMDRGFYKSELVKILQNENIHFIIRAKRNNKIWKYYDFKRKAEGEIYDFQGVPVNLIRIRDSKSRKYGFLTNLPEKHWQTILLWYKQRWVIENIFLACDGIHLKTNSKKIEIKYFCVVFSFIIYNLRTSKNIVSPLLKFCLNLINAILNFLAKQLALKPPNLNLPGFCFVNQCFIRK